MRRLIFIFTGTLLIAVLIFSGMRYRSHEREVRLNKARMESVTLRESMRNAYKKRGAALRMWAKGTPLEKQAEFSSLLVENDGLGLNTPAEFVRFDWVQEQLNLKINLLLGDRKYAKTKPKDWETLEQDVAKTRAEYSKFVIETNRLENPGEPLPAFRAESSLAQ